MWNPSRRMRRRFPLRHKLSATMWLLLMSLSTYVWLLYSMVDEAQQAQSLLVKQEKMDMPQKIPIRSDKKREPVVPVTAAPEVSAPEIPKVQTEPPKQNTGEESAKTEEKPGKVRERKARNRNDGRKNSQEGTDGDWAFWALCLYSCLVSWVRIRLEPSRVAMLRERQQRGILLRPEHPIVRQSFRHINREREARGEEPITMENFRRHRNALLHDPLLWQALAGRARATPTPPPPQGATQEQLQNCTEKVATANETDEDCCICLANYEVDDHIRMLPCKHSFHTPCIDHWFKQSTLCPICKASLSSQEQA